MRQKSSTHIRGTSIPVPHFRDHQVHRVTFDQLPSLSRTEKNWSGTFPRSFIPVSKSPEKSRSHLPVPVSPTTTKSIRFQLPGHKLKSNLSSLFDQNPQTPNQPSSPKSLSPSSTKAKAPVLHTQVRAEEREHRLQAAIMVGKRSRRGAKKVRGNNDVPGAEPASPVINPSTAVAETSTEAGGAVQTFSTVADDVEHEARPSEASTNILEPPEVFVPSEVASTMSSPTTFFSAFASPVSDSTTSGIFDYAMTGRELVPTEKIHEPMLDSLLGEKQIVTDALVEDLSSQVVYINNGTSNQNLNPTAAELAEFRRRNRGIAAPTTSPNTTPIGAGQTAHTNGTSSSDEQDEQEDQEERSCQGQASSGQPPTRRRDGDKDDDAPGPAASGSVASTSSSGTLAPQPSRRGGDNNNSYRATPSATSTRTTPKQLDLRNYRGIEDIRFGILVDVPRLETIQETLSRCLHPSTSLPRDFTAFFSHNHSKSRSALTNNPPANHPLVPAIIITDSSQQDTSAEDSDDSDMATVVPDDHNVEDMPHDVVSGEGADAQTDNSSSAIDASSSTIDADAQPEGESHDAIAGEGGDAQPESSSATAGAQTKKKKKKNKKKDTAKADEGATVNDGNEDATVTDEDAALVEKEKPHMVECINSRGEQVSIAMTEEEMHHYTVVRPDLRWQADQRPQPSKRCYGEGEKINYGKPKMDEFNTYTTINPYCRTYYRPGNYLRDRNPTPGLYIDGACVEAYRGITPEQDVLPAWAPTRKSQDSPKVR